MAGYIYLTGTLRKLKCSLGEGLDEDHFSRILHLLIRNGNCIGLVKMKLDHTI